MKASVVSTYVLFDRESNTFSKKRALPERKPEEAYSDPVAYEDFLLKGA